MKSTVESRAMNLSLATGVGMLIAKWIAFLATGSSVIFSDAAESVVHIIAVWFAWYAVRVTNRPPDHDHHFGHDKIAFVSAGVEGALICIAAVVIIISATERLVQGASLERLGFGMSITAGAGAVNAALGLYLIRVGRRRHSLVVEANGQHVMTDAWTSLGAVVGLLLADLTGQVWLDPVMAIIFGANIIREGVRLTSTSVNGLMDRTDPALEQTVRSVLDQWCERRACSFHRLRVRLAGHVVHVDFHLQVADELPMIDAHALATAAEDAVRAAVDRPAEILSHLEPRTHPDDHV